MTTEMSQLITAAEARQSRSLSNMQSHIARAEQTMQRMLTQTEEQKEELRNARIEQEKIKQHVLETEKKQIDLSQKTEQSMTEFRSTISAQQRTGEERAARADSQFEQIMARLALALPQSSPSPSTQPPVSSSSAEAGEKKAQ